MNEQDRKRMAERRSPHANRYRVERDQPRRGTVAAIAAVPCARCGCREDACSCRRFVARSLPQSGSVASSYVPGGVAKTRGGAK